MKLHILSDLHLEIAPWTPPQTDADVVVLAGDIHTKGRGVAWALEHFTQPVVYVPGNHELWKNSNWMREVERLKELAQGTRVHVLDNEVLTLDGVRFIGSTLWTDFKLMGNEQLSKWDAREKMRDFKHIRNENFSRITPEQTITKHIKAVRFLEQELHKEVAGPTVVVTHHAPTLRSLHPYYRDNKESWLNAAYASDLSRLMGYSDLWVHGHTHVTLDDEFFGTRLVSNQRGYDAEDDPKDLAKGKPPHLNPDFIPDWVIEV